MGSDRHATHRPARRALRSRCAPAAAVIAAALAALSGCDGARPTGLVRAVGVESQYADVISQIGGRYVAVTAILSNPNTNPHAFEASPAIMREIVSANLLVENGLGYDAWVGKLLGAAPSSRRAVINVQQLLRLPDTTVNPHLWYAPQTMPAVAQAVADALATLEPEAAPYFHANARKFDASLAPWTTALASIARRHRGAPVAVTGPVANYLLDAAGLGIATPTALQLAIMNGTDPAPQDIATENALLTERRVRVLVYNQQVTSSLTEAFLDRARRAGIPVLGVHETLPAGDHYQRWMIGVTHALAKALARGSSMPGPASGNAKR